jgi:signal transduction histidine kinase/CheY-like chemotaxis protein
MSVQPSDEPLKSGSAPAEPPVPGRPRLRTWLHRIWASVFPGPVSEPEAPPAIALVLAEDGRILDATPAAEAAYGYSADEWRQLTFGGLRSPDLPALSAEDMGRAEREGSRLESVHRRKDGGLLPVSLGFERTLLPEPAWRCTVWLRAAARSPEQALAERARQLEEVRALTEEITRELDVTTLLQLILRRAMDLTASSAASIRFWDEATESLVPYASQNIQPWVLRLGEGVGGAVAKRRQGMIVNDFRNSPYATPRHLESTTYTAVLAEPLLYQDRLVGVISISRQPGESPFLPEHAELVRLFAAPAAIAIENARLFREREQAAREAQSLYEVSHSLTTLLNPQEVLNLITAKTRELLGTPHAQVVLWDEETKTLRLGAVRGPEADRVRQQEFRLGQGINGIVAQSQAPLIVNDYQAFTQRMPDLDHIVAGIGVPLLYRGRLLGVLTSHSTQPGWAFTQDHLRLLTSFASQAAITLENARLYQQEQSRRRQLEAARAVSEEIIRELNLSPLLKIILRRSVELVEAADGVILLWDEGNQVLVPQVWTAYREFMPFVRVRLGDDVPGLAAEQRAGRFVNDYRTWPKANPLFLDRTPISAVLAEPLLYRNKLVGVLALYHNRGERLFTEEERQLVMLLAAQAAIAIENARLFTELNQSFQHLQQAQDTLIRTEKLRALGQMAAGIAHDLNNMLAAILGQVELLRLRVASPEVQEGLTLLETAATDGAGIVRRLQDFSRQRTSSALTPLELGPLVLEAVEITRPRWRDEAQRRGKAIDVRVEVVELPRILGHASDIREALTNLIFNAVDAMPQGGSLVFTGRAEPEAVILQVADTGVGMPEEIRDHIFEPFFTTKGLRGTGLGLSVVYGIMERHGGRIDVESAPGAGTTFTLRFQIAHGEAVRRDPAAPDAVPPRRLVLIDDDAMVRQTLASLLRAYGQVVFEAESGPAGLAILEQQAVEVVLTDLGMPEMTGWEVARKVKEQYPHLPILLLTGWGDQVVMEAEERVLVDKVLSKPVPLEALLQALSELKPPKA